MALIFAVMHLYNIFFIASVHSFFFLNTYKKNLVLINRRNGPRYQRVLALRAFLTGVMPKGLILRKFCVRCLCMFCFMSCKLVSGLILWFMETLWFDDLCA